MINPIPFIKSFFKYEQKIVISFEINNNELTYNISATCVNAKEFTDAMRAIADNFDGYDAVTAANNIIENK